MKWVHCAVAVVLMTGSVGCAASDKKPVESSISWVTDFEVAKQQAAKRGVPILADFSGSDWCGWCIKLDKEVFSKKAFLEYAQKNLILFLADFPSRKQLPPKVSAQNEALAKRYNVRGFPTVLLLDAKGNVLARTGYKPGGPDAYITHIKGLLKSNAQTL